MYSQFQVGASLTAAHVFISSIRTLINVAVCKHVRAVCLVVRHSGIVEEKEGGARDLLIVHGLQPWVLHAAWGLTYAIMFLIISAAITAVCALSFLHHTQPSLLLVRRLSSLSSIICMHAALTKDPRLHYFHLACSIWLVRLQSSHGR